MYKAAEINIVQIFLLFLFFPLWQLVVLASRGRIADSGKEENSGWEWEASLAEGHT